MIFCIVIQVAAGIVAYFCRTGFSLSSFFESGRSKPDRLKPVLLKSTEAYGTKKAPRDLSSRGALAIIEEKMMVGYIDRLFSQEQCGSFAVDQEQRAVSSLANGFLELSDVLHWLMVHFLNHVTLTQSGGSQRAGRIDVRHHHTGYGRGQSQLLRGLRIEILHRHSIQSLLGWLLVGLGLVLVSWQIAQLDAHVRGVAVAYEFEGYG